MKHQTSLLALSGILLLSTLLSLSQESASEPKAQTSLRINVDSVVPRELNPGHGGAPDATPEQAVAFAWQEFIALNWLAGSQEGKPGQRDTPSTTLRFGDPDYTGPTVWETFRSKVEIFPAMGDAPGYKANPDISFGYDALPQYNYASTIAPANPRKAAKGVPWINLDETDQITLDNMYAGVVMPDSSPGNSHPQLIRFLAKANRVQYRYVASKQWWSVPNKVQTDTIAYLNSNKKSPPADSKDLVSLPYGTIEIKAAWRPLNPSEKSSGRFHTQLVRFYESVSDGNIVYHDAIWGLVALHIIQKTESAPYFIYATFEQADNILTAVGQPVEDENGRIIANPQPVTATSPQVTLLDPRPAPGASDKEVPSADSSIILFNPAEPFCAAPGSRLYYVNENGTGPGPGAICVNKRAEAIPAYVIKSNTQAHAAMSTYFKQKGIKTAPWLYYKLVNVQYYPYDKDNGMIYMAQPPYTARNPAPSSYYQANIVVETNRSLQLFSGGLSTEKSNGRVTDWYKNGKSLKNTFYQGHAYNMGGCMGCHGSQGQKKAGDFRLCPTIEKAYNNSGLVARSLA